jgi:hypothetical protein
MAVTMRNLASTESNPVSSQSVRSISASCLGPA